MKSMTGYAKKQCVFGEKKTTIEIKTLNSKQLDANVKLPNRYRSKDLDIRSMLNQLERGKIDVILTEEDGSIVSTQLNKELLKARYNDLILVADELQACEEKTTLLSALIRQPDIWANNQNDEISDAEWSALRNTIQEAIDEVDAFRKNEGEILKLDFHKHIDLIEQKSLEIPQYEAERIDIAKERIRKYIEDFQIKNVDENRFEQELIYYLEKLDITEEKVRLRKHIDYFRHTMENEDCSGKKLGFIVQEIGREINTTGSKANHVEIQKLVVQMKDELEKIKEQLGNIL